MLSPLWESWEKAHPVLDILMLKQQTKDTKNSIQRGVFHAYSMLPFKLQ